MHSEATIAWARKTLKDFGVAQQQHRQDPKDKTKRVPPHLRVNYPIADDILRVNALRPKEFWWEPIDSFANRLRFLFTGKCETTVREVVGGSKK